MNKVFVSRRVEKKLRKGQVLLEEVDFPDLSETDQEVELFSQRKEFLGKAYLSSQNKGIGWFVTNQKVYFNQNLLTTDEIKTTNTIYMRQMTKGYKFHAYMKFYDFWEQSVSHAHLSGSSYA